MTGQSGTESGGRHAFVDVAKGLCIVLVVMMHSTLGTGEALGGEGFLHPVVAFAKPFRIPAFFVLSGLFLGRALDRDWRTFADRRVVHFAYFYLLWLVIQSGARYGQIAGDGGPAAFLAHLAYALVEPYSTLWFIYLLAVFSVTTKLLRRVPAPLLLMAAALLQIAPAPVSSELVDEFCGRYVFFLGGYLFAGPILRLAARAPGRPLVALVGLLAWAAAEAWLALTPAGPSGTSLAALPVVGLALGAAGALALSVLAALANAAGGPAAFLRTCGDRSIAIYLAFFLPMAATRTLIAKTGLVTDVGIASLAVTLVALLVPLALERAVRGTRLGFLFVRPRAFHLVGEASRPPAALRAV